MCVGSSTIVTCDAAGYGSYTIKTHDNGDCSDKAPTSGTGSSVTQCLKLAESVYVKVVCPMPVVAPGLVTVRTAATTNACSAGTFLSSQSHMQQNQCIRLGSTEQYFTAVCPASSVSGAPVSGLRIFSDSACRSAVDEILVQAVSGGCKGTTQPAGAINYSAIQAYCSSSGAAMPSGMFALVIALATTFLTTSGKRFLD